MDISGAVIMKIKLQGLFYLFLIFFDFNSSAKAAQIFETPTAIEFINGEDAEILEEVERTRPSVLLIASVPSNLSIKGKVKSKSEYEYSNAAKMDIWAECHLMCEETKQPFIEIEDTRNPSETWHLNLKIESSEPNSWINMKFTKYYIQSNQNSEIRDVSSNKNEYFSRTDDSPYIYMSDETVFGGLADVDKYRARLEIDDISMRISKSQLFNEDENYSFKLKWTLFDF